MADLLDSVQRQLRERLDELRPLVSEYERLVAAEQALSAQAGEGGNSQRSRGRPTRGRQRRSTASRRASTPAERQANRERVLAILAERPGVSRAELKQATGLSGAGVAQNLRRLIESGDVVEEPLPSGEAGYRVAAGEGASGSASETVADGASSA